MMKISVISTLLMFINTLAKIFTTYYRKVRNGQKYVCDTQRPPFQYLPRNAYQSREVTNEVPRAGVDPPLHSISAQLQMSTLADQLQAFIFCLAEGENLGPRGACQQEFEQHRVFEGKQSLFPALEKCPNYCFCVKLDAAAAAACQQQLEQHNFEENLTPALGIPRWKPDSFLETKYFYLFIGVYICTIETAYSNIVYR